MPDEVVTIFDSSKNIVASGVVVLQGDSYSGSIRVDQMPESVRQLFEEYEEIVNGQMFSLLDRIEDQINAMRFAVVFEGGRELLVEDIQIFPKAGTLSFKNAPQVPK